MGHCGEGARVARGFTSDALLKKSVILLPELDMNATPDLVTLVGSVAVCHLHGFLVQGSEATPLGR